MVMNFSIVARSALAALALTGSVAAFSPAVMAQDAQQRIEWNQPYDPFRVHANVYYVGTEGLSAFLIADQKGLILIDGGLPESAPLILANIRKLGFDPEDIKYLLINHNHFDHAGGLAAIKQETGATLVASALDTPDLEAGKTPRRPELDSFTPVKVDRQVKDGAKLRLGSTVLTAHVTPGHTPGCTSWSTVAGGKNILFACSLTVAGQKLKGDVAYPNAADDFRATFRKLRAVQADIFLNFHPDFFNIKDKRAAQLAGKYDAFIDPSELSRQLDDAEASFAKELEKQSR